MAQQRTRYEQRSILDALETYLGTEGYSGFTFSDGYQPEAEISPPHVTVHFPPSSPRELQLGRVQGQESLYRRSVVVNAYMENQGRADAIVDLVIDFLDLTCITVKDHEDNVLGTLQCYNTDGIVGQTFAPIMGNPKNIRWRGSVTAPMESYYPNS